MADIFISYSRKDSEHALTLAEKLRASGMEVWIDQHGISGADQWASRIAEGIRGCSTFLLLLSPNSVESENVLRELSLATERRKRILPVELSPSDLPLSFEYSLAGLQRIAISDFDGIVRAHKHGVTRVKSQDLRKSLIVLPFEDLSPVGEDNAWFADGLVSEMIDSLSHIKALRLIDRKTSMELKIFKGKTQEIADALQVRYFIQGNVRKFDEQIKISVSLLDIESGDYLWQESHRGEFKDIFDIQEAVATKVVEGLKLTLTNEEKEKLLDRGTENAEAYELFIKAGDSFDLHTGESYQHAIQLLTDAIRLDPGYANAYKSKAQAISSIYRNYDRDSTLLVEAEALIQQALHLKPDLWIAYSTLSVVYHFQGKINEAEQAASLYVARAADDARSHHALGYYYWLTGQYSKAIAPFEEAVRLQPDSLDTLWNLVVNCDRALDDDKLAQWSAYAVPFFQRHLRLHPDDEHRRVHLACLLAFSNRTQEAREAAKSLESSRDGGSLFNTANLWASLYDQDAALRCLRKSIEAGYRNVSLMKGFLQDTLAPLQGTVEFEQVREMLNLIDPKKLSSA